MGNEPGRIIGVDPGEKRTGIALSDPTRTIASTLTVIEHTSRNQAARMILDLAEEHEAALILIGHPLDDDGNQNPQSQKSVRLAEEIQAMKTVEVILWDEFGSTKQAQQTRRDLNVSRKKRSGHLDGVAAVIILQDYLDSLMDEEDR